MQFCSIFLLDKCWTFKNYDDDWQQVLAGQSNSDLEANESIHDLSMLQHVYGAESCFASFIRRLLIYSLAALVVFGFSRSLVVS